LTSTLSSPGGGRCLRRPAPSGARRRSADPARRLPIIGRGPQSKAHLRTGSQSSGRRAGKESSACPRASTLCAWSLGAASDGWSSAFQSASGSHVSRAIVCTLKVHTIERAADGGEGRGEDAGEYARHRSLWPTECGEPVAKLNTSPGFPRSDSSGRCKGSMRRRAPCCRLFLLCGVSCVVWREL
jgi:hypothetical protein